MKLLVVVACFVTLLSMTAANPLSFLGAAKGALALGTAVAKLVTSAVPSGLLLPLALVAPLKLSLPLLLGLKGMGLFKLKLFLLKAPLLGPIGLGIGKIGLANAKVSLAKTALSTAGKATMALLTLPPKIAAMKVGAIAGAKAGAKTGLASSTMPRSTLIHPMVIPASALLAESRLIAHESARARSYAVSEPEPEEPVYGRIASPTTTTISVPDPAYTAPPEPESPAPEPAYGRRRRRAAPTGTVGMTAIREIFNYIIAMDTDRCVLRVICEISVDPSLAGDDENRNITGFMLSLDDTDPEAPWMPFRNAAAAGRRLGSRQACHKKYHQCAEDTEAIMAIARARLEGDEN